MKEVRRKLKELQYHHKDIVTVELFNTIIDNLDKIDKQKLIDYVYLEINK